MKTDIFSLCFFAAVFVYVELHLPLINSANANENNTTLSHSSQHSVGRKLPTVFIPILARNKAHTLPTFFGYLEQLNYPKDRISLWIRSDHCIDNTTWILYEWASANQDKYHRVSFFYKQEPAGYEGEEGPFDWPEERFNRLIELREEALKEARDQWADYIFAVDVDNFLLEPDILHILMKQSKTIVAPMLKSHTMYSNFWGGINGQGYYKRTDEYVEIINEIKKGLFKVPMVHSTYLVDLRHDVSGKLTYRPLPDFKNDIDDMLTFQFSAQVAGIPMYVINSHNFGLCLIPGQPHERLYDEAERMLHMRLEAMVEINTYPMKLSEHIYIPKSGDPKMGFDEIYMISLARRPDRRRRMLASLKELNIQVKIVDAVDGKALSPDDLRALGIDMLPGYRDPYSKRVLTKGEIGCFLSHYAVWQDVVKQGYDKILIFEDDVRFEFKFRAKMHFVLDEIKQFKREWDLIYVGRKILRLDEEDYLEGSRILVYPSYSYWTISYMLSQTGARKLLDQEPLNRMIPVDEYLPVMFDTHPQTDWAAHFSPRDLKAYSVNPLFVFPTHYTGEPNHISDTETSSIWEEVEKKEKAAETDVDKSKPDTDGSNATNSVKEGETKLVNEVKSSDQDSRGSKGGDSLPERNTATRHTEL